MFLCLKKDKKVSIELLNNPRLVPIEFYTRITFGFGQGLLTYSFIRVPNYFFLMFAFPFNVCVLGLRFKG